MPSYDHVSITKRFQEKPDIHSRAVMMLSCLGNEGESVGTSIAVSSRRNRDILRVLMANTGWNMILVGKIPTPEPGKGDFDATCWADVIDVAAEVELESGAPRVEKVLTCSDGILVRFAPNEKWKGSHTSKAGRNRLKKAVQRTAEVFRDVDYWGDSILRPVVAEETS